MHLARSLVIRFVRISILPAVAGLPLVLVPVVLETALPTPVLGGGSSLVLILLLLGLEALLGLVPRHELLGPV